MKAEEDAKDLFAKDFDAYCTGFGAYPCSAYGWALSAKYGNSFMNTAHMFGPGRVIAKVNVDMECALYLKERGHEPIIVDMDDHLGGQFVIAGAAPGKEEFIQAVKEETELVRRAGIEIRTNTKVTPEYIRDTRPDTVVLAIGAGPLILPIKGADLPFVTNAHGGNRAFYSASRHAVPR